MLHTLRPFKIDMTHRQYGSNFCLWLVAGVTGNSLALLIMTRSGVSGGPLREKLANFVASAPADRFCYFVNHIEKLVSMMALGEYDMSRGSADPDLQLKVRSGDTNLLEVRSELAHPVAPVDGF